MPLLVLWETKETVNLLPRGQAVRFRTAALVSIETRISGNQVDR